MRCFRCLIFILSAFLLIVGCHPDKQRDETGFNIIGAWELIRLEHPDGQVDTMDTSLYTRCKIYDADSTYYSVELLTDGTMVMVVPHEMAEYCLHDTVYVENGRLTPFQIINDSTMTTIWDGDVEVMRKAYSMTESRKKEICDIVRSYYNNACKTDRISNFVLSTSERELKETNHRYLNVILLLALSLVILCDYLFNTVKRKREIERNLLELQKIRDARPTPVTYAMKENESKFFQSDYFLNLRRKIETGSNLSGMDWEQLEAELKAVYPDFCTALYQYHNISPLEYHVCLLTKIRCTPSEIAAVLKKEINSISSIRSRLYYKFFNRKGGAKDWDAFIMSL